MKILKPCPFCGGKATRYLVYDKSKIVCSNCSAGITGQHQDVEDMWNNRSEQRPQPPSQPFWGWAHSLESTPCDTAKTRDEILRTARLDTKGDSFYIFKIERREISDSLYTHEHLLSAIGDALYDEGLCGEMGAYEYIMCADFEELYREFIARAFKGFYENTDHEFFEALT